MMLSDVCLSRTSGITRERRGLYRNIKIGTEVAHVTRDSDTTFKVKRSKVKVTRPYWLAVLAGQHGHRVSDRSICVYDVYRVTTVCAGPPRASFHGVWDSAGPACPDCYRSAQLRHQGPRTWNSLPPDLRTPDTTLCSFKRQLKAPFKNIQTYLLTYL